MTADRSSRPAPPPKAARGPEKEAGDDGPVSNALRSAYEEAVKEEVPAEFLDLLGKLS